MLIGRIPQAPLSRFIELLWYAEAWKPPHDRERHMPDGSVNLVISLRGGSAGDTRAIFSGPRSEAVVLNTSQPNTVIGVHFRRGAAGRFIDLPVSELANAHVPLIHVAGTSKSLCERLLETHGPEARFDVLQQWLMERLLRRPERDPAIAWAVRQLEYQPHMRISAVAEKIGRSSRWFVHRFATEVGLTPKVFSRVQRFQLALRHMHASDNVDLADVAAGAGYFDQAHFTHDFRSIAGITPAAYVAARTEHHNHVALLD